MDALYELQDHGVFATEYTRGPWDPGHQHGGAPAALLMRAFESTEPDPALQITRVTYELVKPVPLGELSISASITRPGRRVQLLEGAITAPDGTEVVRARALRVRRAPLSAGLELSPEPAGAEAVGGPGRVAGDPDSARAVEFGNPSSVLFPTHGMDVRFSHGAFLERGPATAWFKLRVPIVAGEEPSGLQRMAAASDFPNGISSELDWGRYLFINPDLTLYVEREPVGDWIALVAAMRVVEGGAGISQAIIYDQSGRVGRSIQSLYVAER